MVDVRAEQALRRMHHRRLLREAATDPKEWALRQIALLLHRSGYLLVAAGRRLQQIGAPHGTRVEEQVAIRATSNS
jgi:hypothetical protein